VISYPNTFWTVAPEDIPAYDPASPRSRFIRIGGPLINLGSLQTLLCSGNFDMEQQLWLATDKCRKDLRKEQWSVDDVLQMLVNMDPVEDYDKSEWCQVAGGRMAACDVYATRYDAAHRRRHPQGLPVYLKFSIDENDVVTIALVSCHAS
jgi:hypothetical protein